MASTGSDGRGDRLYVSGVDVSSDVSALTNLTGGWETAPVTEVTQAATSRIGTLQRGELSYVSFFDRTVAHPVLSALPTTDVISTYIHGTDPTDRTAGLVAKQADYPATRATDGSLTLHILLTTTGSTVEWGRGYVAGISRTDTAPTNGAGVDDTNPTSSGLSSYLHVTAFTGTTATISVQHSDDNGVIDPWTTVYAFTPVTVASNAQRVTTSTSPIKRWLRTITTGTFSSITFHVMASRLAGLIFASATVAVDIQLFTASGTWTKPSGGQTVTTVILIGGGGGASGGAQRAVGVVATGGASGQGGGLTVATFRTVDLAATETVAVGAGGAGGAAQTVPSSGVTFSSIGGNTTFGTVVKAVARRGGKSTASGTGGGNPGAMGGEGTSPGGFGGSSSASGLAGSSGAPHNNIGFNSGSGGGTGGGGSGGGITAAEAVSGGGGGGTAIQLGQSAGISGGAINTSGGSGLGAAANLPIGGGGGAGGGSSVTGVGGSGGDGGLYGGGGGGGGASRDGFNSGAGGSGAAGIALIISL